MAQKVGYFQNNVTYLEGPFVIVDANGWRIEVEREGHQCPILPELSIYRLMEKLGMATKTTEDKAAAVCDALNAMVKSGMIVKQGKGWMDNRQGYVEASFHAMQATV